MQTEIDLSREQAFTPPLVFDPRPTGPVAGMLLQLAKRPVEKLLLFDQLNDICHRFRESEDCRAFSDAVLDHMGVRWEPPMHELERIPASGPVVVVANHPFGAIEGLVLISLLSRMRPDSRVLANYLLSRVPKIQPVIIPVDPFGSNTATRRNFGPMKEALRWLRSGGALGVFPSGEVSHLKLGQKGVADPVWNPMIGRLIRETGATVVPVYFDGTNGAFFQIAGLIHPRIRTALLPHELLNKKERPLTVRIGNPISPEKMRALDDGKKIIEYARFRTYHLANRADAKQRRSNGNASIAKLAPIVPPVDPVLLARELASLGDSARLVENGEYSAYIASANEIPHILREIGRLREHTFRQVGEGTGAAIDLDRFDARYLHLFVWNHNHKEIVGSYRLGLTDRIMSRHGINGLYTRTLFRYSRPLIDRITPAIELGRSFVRLEYQKEYAPLHLLWRGIGKFVSDNPKYRTLFGPVSISNDYGAASRHLLASFLQANNFAVDLAPLVKARKPLKVKGVATADAEEMVSDLDEVTSLIREIETEKCSIPVLLRHYLKLGGKLLGFNVDPQFSDALDGLILVDLVSTQKRILEKYLGKDGVERFYWYHRVQA